METSPIRLLLVDDHPLVRDGLRARLSALEGLAVVGEALRCRPTLVLMDVGMREVNGIELAARLPTTRACGC